MGRVKQPVPRPHSQAPQRANIYLRAEDRAKLEALALADKTSKSETIRLLIDAAYKRRIPEA